MSREAIDSTNIWPVTPLVPLGAALTTCEGELLQVSVRVRLRDLEGALTALGTLPFPINPEVIHLKGHAGHPKQDICQVRVQFPVYSRRLAAVRGSLEQYGITPGALDVCTALTPAQI